ncbi:MAG TPA: hypothetical protein VD929_11510 [Caulobacteraceae bacterium]|nr:hypothetical protein [Caulobacteraceae bacterium]
MVEREFEAKLERMFSEPAPMPDADLFARAVEERLDRAWRLRTVGIAAAGAIGGVIALGQTVGAGFGMRLREASSSSAVALDQALNDMTRQGEALLGFGMGAGMFWTVSAMMVIAAGIAATRLLDEV